jgi:hypothetical protein
MGLKLMGLLLVLLLAGQVQDYEIRLDRPTAAGTRYRLSTTGHEVLRTKVTTGDKTLKEDEEGFTLELVADVTDLELSAKGRPTRKSFTVVSSKLTEGGSSKTLLPAGSAVLVFLQGGRAIYQIGGKEAEAGVAKALSSVISVPVSPTGDDDLFGSRVRRKVGESWGVNVDDAMALLKEIGVEGRREDVTGSTTLEKVEGNRLFLRGSLRIANVLLPLPIGFKPERGELRAEFSGRFPVENSAERVDQTQRIVFDVTGRREPDADNPELRINLFFDGGSTYQIVPLSTKQRPGGHSAVRPAECFHDAPPRTVKGL